MNGGGRRLLKEMVQRETRQKEKEKRKDKNMNVATYLDELERTIN